MNKQSDTELIEAFLEATAGLPQVEAGQLAGVSQKRVSDWRRGERGVLKSDTRSALERFLASQKREHGPVRERGSGYGAGGEGSLDRAELDRRRSEILGSTTLNPLEKSALLLDLTLSLRAEALRDLGITARLNAEEAAHRRQQLADGLDRGYMPTDPEPPEPDREEERRAS